jgi:glycosyltransferase involved in cell wall biosynthesis
MQTRDELKPHDEASPQQREVKPGTRLSIFLQDLGGGGAERMMLNLAEEMVRRGYLVDIVVGRLEGAYASRLPEGVRLIDLGVNRTMATIMPFARYIRKERPVAILSALVHVNVAAVVGRALSFRRPRLVVSERNTISVDVHSDRSPAIVLAHKLVPWLYPRADSIIAVSNGVADDLAAFANLPRNRIKAINNPVVTPELRRLAKQPLDDPWFGADQPPVVLAVGRLAPQKDFETLVAAFALLRKQREARLIILGEGPERQSLETQIASLGLTDDVRLPGFADNPYAYMANAGLLVLSSRWEGSPNVLAEALACGTPAVSTDCPSGPRETLLDGRLGHIVPMGDAEKLAEAMRETLASPPPRDALLARADDFTVEHATDAYLQELLGA